MKKRRSRGDGSLMERRPGVWRLRVFIESDPRGRPIQAERTYRGNKTEALAELRRFVAEVHAGKVTKRTKHTVAHLLSTWLDYGEKVMHWAPLTVISRRGIIANHLIPALGDISLAKLKPTDIIDYYTGLEFRPSTMRAHHEIIRGALAQAVEWEWIPSSPAARVKEPKVPNQIGRVPSVEEVRLLIDAADDDIDLATAVALAAITGLRRGELCGLQWGDVDWERGTLRVERQRIRAERQSLTTGLKGGGSRVVSVGDMGLEVLRRYCVQACEQRAADLGVVFYKQGWLLSHDLGRTPLNPDQLGAQISRLGKRTGIPVTAHAFRRFAATQMIGNGADVRVAATRLGHSTGVMFNSYVGSIPGKDAEAARMLESLVLGDREVRG